MNRVRVRYIRNHSMLHFKSTSESKPLHNLKIADIGCGGGILTEVCSFIAHFFIYITGGSRLYVVSGDRWWPLIREVRISRQHRDTLLSIQKRAGSSIVVELPVAFEVSCSFPSLSHFSFRWFDFEKSGMWYRLLYGSRGTCPGSWRLCRISLTACQGALSAFSQLNSVSLCLSPEDFCSFRQSIARYCHTYWRSVQQNTSLDSFLPVPIHAFHSYAESLCIAGTHNWSKFVTPQEMEHFITVCARTSQSMRFWFVYVATRCKYRRYRRNHWKSHTEWLATWSDLPSN